MTGHRGPRAAHRLVHQGRGQHPPQVVPGPAGQPTVVLELPAVRSPAQGALYAVGRCGRARRRRSDVAEVGRRVWALRILLGAWTVSVGLVLWFTVTWFGWLTAAFTQPPLLAMPLVLAYALRAERRWLIRLSTAVRP